MASIPLPALGIHAPQQPQNPLEQYGNLLQLKNAIQQSQLQQQEAPLRLQALQQGVQQGNVDLQQKQQALKDQQAMTAAMQSWDGKDVNGLIPLVIKNGASANAVMGLKSKVLEQQQTYSKIAADDATTGAKNLETMKGKNDMIAGALDNVMHMPDEQLAQGLVSTAQDLAQKGLIDPQHAQVAAQLAQSGNPAQIRQQLGIMQKGLMSESQQMEAAAKQATIQKDQSQTALNQMNLQRGGTTDMDKFIYDYLQSKGLDNTPANRQKAFQEYTRETKIAPAQVRAQVYMQTPTQVYDPNSGQVVYAARKDAIGMQAPSSADAIAGKAAVQADAASLKKMQANFDNVTAFENTAGKNLDQFLSTAKGVIDSGSPLINSPLRSVSDRMAGSDKMAAFNAARATALTEISKVLNSSNASGVLSDSARHEVEGLIGPDATLKQIYSAAQILKQDMKNRHDSYQQQIGQIQGRLKGGGQQQPNSTPNVGDTKTFPNGKVGKWDGQGWVAQ